MVHELKKSCVKALIYLRQNRFQSKDKLSVDNFCAVFLFDKSYNFLPMVASHRLIAGIFLQRIIDVRRISSRSKLSTFWQRIRKKFVDKLFQRNQNSLHFEIIGFVHHV